MTCAHAGHQGESISKGSLGFFRRASLWVVLALIIVAFGGVGAAGAQASPATFFRGINLGGDAVSIDSNAWLANSGSTRNVTMEGSAACNEWLTFNPAVTGAFQTMLSCWREHWAHNIAIGSVPNGQYQVYIYAIQSWENTAATPFSILLEGSSVGSYNPGTVPGVWAKLGPYAVAVSDGTLNLATSGGTSVLSGIEIWSGGSASAASATATSGAAAATPAPTVVAQAAQAVSAASASTTAATASETGTAIPRNIRNALAAGGVNLVFSFYDVDSYDPNAFDADLPVIAASGARHVRIPISMDIIEEGTSGTLRADRYRDIVNFVVRAREHGLVTIIDVHNTAQKRPDGFWNEDYMGGLREESVRTRHIALMTEFVRRLYLENVDRNWFVFQPANEPIFTNDPQVWYDHQVQLLPAMREACPDCVMFAMAHDWQGITATINGIDPSVAPYNDPLLIFDVHFYEPLNLTHCRYQGGEDNCPRIAWPGNFSTWRGNDFWDRAFLSNLFAGLWEWKARHDVFVHFSEIGTADALDDAVRAAYLGDVVGLIREHGAGYSIYDWSSSFSIRNSPLTLAAVFSPR